MFEDLVGQLESVGAEYTEDYDAGTLTVDVSALDKVTLISVIQIANDSGLEFTIDDSSLTVMGGAGAMDLGPADAGATGEEDYQALALEEMPY